MHVEVVSPESITYSGEASMVVCRTVGGGDIAFLSGHVPDARGRILQILRHQNRNTKVIHGDDSELFAVHQGFVQTAGEKITILSDVSEAKSTIDIERAQSAKSKAEAAISLDDDDEAAHAALERAETRLRVAGVEPT